MSVEKRPAFAEYLVLAVGRAILIARVVGERERNVWPALAQGLTRFPWRYFVKKNFLYLCKQSGQFHFRRVVRNLTVPNIALWTKNYKIQGQ
jgi:hypothetical protein